MSIAVVEKFDSRPLTDERSHERLYLVRGTDSESAALSALKGAAPGSANGMTRGDCEVEPIGDGSDWWLGRAPYAPASYTKRDPPQTGESTYQFEIGLESTRITQAKAHVAKYARAGWTIPDCHGAIGVESTPDGVSVQGCEVQFPVYHFSETHYLSSGTVTGAYKATLFGLTGKVSNDTFRGFAAGECLFLGAAGAMRGGGDWEITYRFAASPNRANFDVGGITVTSKKGWEYMWVMYADDEDAAAKRLIKIPMGVYIERVYDEGDFSQIGIGT